MGDCKSAGEVDRSGEGRDGGNGRVGWGGGGSEGENGKGGAKRSSVEDGCKFNGLVVDLSGGRAGGELSESGPDFGGSFGAVASTERIAKEGCDGGVGCRCGGGRAGIV